MGHWGRASVVLVVTLALSGLSLVLRPAPAAAQISRADSAAVLLSAAERFRSEDQTGAAEAVLRLIIRSFGNTPAAARAQELLASLPADEAAQSGRTELKVWSTLYGLWLGVALPTAFGANDPEPYGLGLLLGGPAGFLAGSQIARSRDLTTGQARAITLGGTWGSWQGLGWVEVADIGQDEFCDPQGPCFETGSNTEELIAGAVIGGLSGIAVGTLLSGRDITPGVATTVNFGALWGSWFGVAGGVVADLEGDALMTSTLLAGNAGLLFTALRAPNWRVTRSRARLVSIAGVIGGLGGAGLDLLIQPDNSQLAFGIPLLTSTIGLVVGVYMTRDRLVDLEGGGGPDGPALLNLDRRRLSLDLPLPAPIVRPTGPGGADRRLALWIPILSGRF